MKTMSNLLSGLLTMKAEPQNVTRCFNVIDELNANENAHTRILAALLENQKILFSFLQMIRQSSSCPSAFKNLNDDAFRKISPDEIETFSDYMDLTISGKDFTIILENKIRNAGDQDRQIERYVEQALHNTRTVFVVYLTLNDDKKVSDGSFTESCREKLESAHGGFIPVNYKDDILPWLKTKLCFSVDEQLNQPYLQSGIIQYIDHLNGLLGERKECDPYSQYKVNLKKQIGTSGMATELLTEIEYYLGYRRAYLLKNPSLINQDFIKTEAELRDLLQRLFRKIWGAANPCSSGWTDLGTCGDAVSVSAYHWSNLSPIQLELYRDGTPAEQYKIVLDDLKQKLKASQFEEPLSDRYQDSECLKYPVYTAEDVYKISAILKDDDSLVLKESARTETAPNVLRLDVEKLELLKNCIMEIYPAEERNGCTSLPDTVSEKTGINSGYHYDDHGVALHVYSHDAERIPVAEMWLKDGNPAKILQHLEQGSEIYPYFTYYWQRKTLLEFPIIDCDYGEKLIDTLKRIQASLN